MKRLFRSPAHVITLLWAGAWTHFFIFESFRWGAVAEAPLWVALGLLFVLLAIISWRWQRLGGALLLVCGIGLLLAYDIWPPRQLDLYLIVILELLLAVPPLITGLLLVSRRAECA